MQCIFNKHKRLGITVTDSSDELGLRVLVHRTCSGNLVVTVALDQNGNYSNGCLPRGKMVGPSVAEANLEIRRRVSSIVRDCMHLTGQGKLELEPDCLAYLASLEEHHAIIRT